MNFFRSSNKTAIGLDIGSHSVKAVQLLKEGPSSLRLLALGVAEIGQPRENHFETIIPAVNNALKDCNLKKTQLITSLGGSSVVIRQINFPSSSYKEIESSLKWEGSHHIPMPVDTVEMRFQIRKVSKDEKSSEVLLVAVNKALLQNHLTLLSEMQLEPHIIDVNPLALANAFLALTPNPEDKNIAIIGVGASTTTVTIFRKDGLFFTRDISLAGNRFTREIQSIYHLDYPQAELFKKEETIDQHQMQPVFNQLLSDIRQSLLFYDTRTGNNGYEEIILTGGGANLPGLSSYLEKNLSLPVIEFNPLNNLQMDEHLSGSDLTKVALQLGAAVGLALRG